MSFCVYYALTPPYATPMLMIAAALEEELETAKSLCRDIDRIHADKAKLWKGVYCGFPFLLLRVGVGPTRSAERFKSALQIVKPSEILVTGYAGALDPGLTLGSLVAVENAKALKLDESRPGWEHARVEEQFELMECPSFFQSAAAAGLRASSGDTVTSPHVLGDPAHKRLLHDRFGAAIVDMETAALARVAKSEDIPIRCIRVVSDEAEDAFLAPFSYDPSAALPARAVRLMQTGMVETYREWKTHSSVARECLTRFLSRYLAHG